MQDADYRRLVEDSPLATFLVRGGRVLWTNAAARELLGLPAGEGSAQVSAEGVALDALVHPEDRADVARAVERAAAGRPDGEPPARPGRTASEWRLLRTDGSTVIVEVLLAVVGVDGEPAVSVAAWDVSQHVARQLDLAHRATHDRLTGLPNRSLLEDRWTLARSRARRTGLVPLVAFCDLDDLKLVNDVHGHLAGDLALVAVAERLQRASREEDTVARFGGDEFVVLVESAADVEPDGLVQRLREVTSDVEVALPDGRGTITLSCSVGLVVDDLSETTAEVLARADAEMYLDKRHRHRG